MFEWMAAFSLCLFFVSRRLKHRLTSHWLALPLYYANLAWCLGCALFFAVLWSLGVDEVLQDPAALASVVRSTCLSHRDYCDPVLRLGVAAGALLMHEGRDMALYCCDMLGLSCTAGMLLNMADFAAK